MCKSARGKDRYCNCVIIDSCRFQIERPRLKIWYFGLDEAKGVVLLLKYVAFQYRTMQTSLCYYSNTDYIALLALYVPVCI